MNLKKILLFSFVLLLIGTIVIYFQLLLYGIAQLRGQLTIIIGSNPIEKVLLDPLTPDSTKQKLILIQEIKNFATDSIGIKKSNNYTTFYDQKGKPLLWVLTASEPYALKSVEWQFPMLGNVSYKGFFKKESGLQEEEILKNKGYDTDLGIAGAWSTLGWFKDPILSSMLSRSEGSLANLIVHELTHGTIYIKDDVEFNENLASFFGDQGAQAFLKHKFGSESSEYTTYMQHKRDEAVFTNHVLNTALKLDSLYSSFSLSTPIDFKEKIKTERIEFFISNVESLPLYNKDKYLRIASAARAEKNAFFMAFKRYQEDQNDFELILSEKFNGNLKAYLVHLKQEYSSL